MVEQLGFLLADISRLMRRRFDSAARTLGVTSPQWRILVTVLRDPGASQTWLTEQLEVERITMCRMIDRLERAGLLERREDATDRRIWRIFLTDAAHPLMDRLQDVAASLIGRLLEDFQTEERSRLNGDLAKIRLRLLDDAIWESHQNMLGYAERSSRE